MSRKLNLNCEVCGIRIEKYSRDIRRNKLFYCSRECYNFRRKQDLTRLKRTTKYYDQLLSNAICECGEKSKYLLQIHHIDGNNKNNLPDNLEIVCANCHVKRHLKKLGSGEYVYHPRSLTDRSLLKDL